MVAISIKDGKILEGYLPRKALEMVLEWNEINKNKLLEMWETQEFKELEPLE